MAESTIPLDISSLKIIDQTQTQKKIIYLRWKVQRKNQSVISVEKARQNAMVTLPQLWFDIYQF